MESPRSSLPFSVLFILSTLRQLVRGQTSNTMLQNGIYSLTSTQTAAIVGCISAFTILIIISTLILISFLIFKLIRHRQLLAVNIYEDPDYAHNIADAPIHDHGQSTFVISATNYSASDTLSDDKVDDQNNGYETLIPNSNQKSVYDEIKNAGVNTESDHRYERIPEQNHESTYEEAQTYERVQTYEQILHCDISPQLQPTQLQSDQQPVIDQCSTISHNHHYERAQIYEKVQTYEHIYHCDVSSLPQCLSSRELTIQECSKPSQNNRGDEESGSDSERVQETYERIHHCDVPLHLLPQIKRSEESIVEHSTTLQGSQHEKVDGAHVQTDYERIQHCDILVPLPKPIIDHPPDSSIPLNTEHEQN